VRLTVGEQRLAHDEKAVLAGDVRIERDRLEQDVRALALRLLRGAAVEAPLRDVVELQLGDIAIDDLGLGTKGRKGRVTVEPDVFQFEFGHVGM